MNKYRDQLNYEKDRHIDESALDVEWLNQPNLMFLYSAALAEAESELDGFQEELSLLKADIDKEIRESPKNFDIDINKIKLTETLISNTVNKQEEVQELNKKILDAKYEVKVLKGGVESMQHRKFALQGMVELFSRQYYAGPKVPRNLPEEVKSRFNEEQRDLQRHEANSRVKIRRRNK